jgi:hypothetical protein
MNANVRKFERTRKGIRHPSVLDGPDHIAGLPHAKGSSVEEARKHPDAVKACHSVLDGPACIAGLKH